MSLRSELCVSCPLRFCIKTMFGLYLQLFVVRLMSYLHYLCVFMVVYILSCSCCFFYFSSFCVSYVDSFYGLSIYNYLFSILLHLFTCTVFSVYPHKSMGFAIDQDEVYSIQFYVIILLNVVVDTNNIAILIELSYLRHLRLLSFQDNLSSQCHTDMATYWFYQ